MGELLQVRDSDCSESEENARQWVALNSFLAQCAKHTAAIFSTKDNGDRYVTVGDASMVMSSLEDTPGSERLLDIKVRAAAAWVVEAGHLLFQVSSQFGTRAAGPLWKDSVGTQTRWEFWKRRFSELERSGRVTRDTQRVARYAGMAMSAAEV